MRYCFDIDGTICTPTTGRAYDQAIPYTSRIDHINELYDKGHYIIYFTARAMGRFAGDPDDRQKAKEVMEGITTEHLRSGDVSIMNSCSVNHMLMCLLMIRV
mgnify:CR=1 FL=1